MKPKTSLPYLILGLPRSRTAWLSNFLTYGPSFCYHDGLAYCRKPEDVARLFTGGRFVGNADSSQALFFDNLLELLPVTPRVVVVRRDVDEAFESSEKAGLGIPEEGMLRLDMRLQAISELPGVLTVGFEDLSDQHTLHSIWHHCLRGQVPFNYHRAKMLANFQVQLHAEAIPGLMRKAQSSMVDLIETFTANEQ